MRLRILGSLFYLFYYMAVGGLFPYLNVYYHSISIETVNIGALATLLTLSMLVAAPLWSGLADALHIHRRLLMLVIIATMLPAALMAGTPEFLSLAVLVILVGACLAPIIPLADSAVMVGLGERRNEYGRIRLWGAVGFGVGAWLTGELADLGGMPVMFLFYVVIILPCLLVASQLPVPKHTIGEPYWNSLRTLIRRPGWIRFLISTLLFGMCSSIISNYYGLYLKSLGAPDSMVGLATAVASVGEVPVFLMSAWFLRRWSAATLIRIAFIAMIIRCGLYALIHDPTLAVAVNLMHGLCFSAMWTAGVVYSSQIAPPGLSTSAQSVFAAVSFSLSGILSTLPGSVLYSTFGPSALFATGSLVALTGLILFSTGSTAVKFKRDVVEQSAA